MMARMMPAIELTPRQTEVAQLLVQGCSNLEIAAHLGIAVNTVKRRLGLGSEELPGQRL